MVKVSIDDFRRFMDRLFEGIVYSMSAAILAVLGLILWYILSQGLAALNVEFFLREPRPMGQLGGGIAQAILGTFMIAGGALLLAAPVGVMTAIYLYKSGDGRFPSLVRFCLVRIAAVPSIVVGLFVWVGLVKLLLGHFAGIAGSAALFVIMLPMIARPMEEVLRKLNDDEFRSAKALGLPVWRIMWSVVLPLCRREIFTITISALARASGETAPLMLTALGNTAFNTDMGKPMAAMTLTIFEYANSPYADLHQKAFGTAAVMLIAILIMFITTRWFAGRSEINGK